MFAWLGYVVQAVVTGKGPVECWAEHVANPYAVSGFNYATRFSPAA